MANNVIKSPLVLDTAANDILDGKTFVVYGVRWAGADTAADIASITDQDGRVLWRSTISAAGETVESRLPFKVSGGFNVATLDSGILYLYTDNYN